MDEQPPLTLSDRIFDALVQVPDVPLSQFIAGFVLSMLFVGVAVSLRPMIRKIFRRQKAHKPSSQRVRLSGEELREIRAQRKSRS